MKRVLMRLQPRFHFAVSLLLLAAFALASCGGDDTVEPVPQPGPVLRTVIGMDLFGDGPVDPVNIGKDTLGWWPALDCALNHPTQVSETSDGMLLVTSWHNHKMRLLDLEQGLETVIIGRSAGCDGDGLGVKAVRLDQQSHGIEGPDGAIYILDQRNQVIRRVHVTNNTCASVVGGDPVCSPAIPGSFAGDGLPPDQARLSFPTGPNPDPGGGITFDDQGRLYISDTMNQRIRMVDFNANVINTVAGNGIAGYNGDGGDPLLACINRPLDLQFGPDGRLYFADSKNHAVRAVDFTGNVIVTVAGTGVEGFSGDGGPATSAQLAEPRGIAFDYNGDLIIADTYNHRFRRVSGGTITTWAGTGEAGFDGDGHSLLKSQFYWPIDVEFTPTLGVFFVDWNNHRIRQIVNG